MKLIIRNIFTIVSAIYFLFAGTGYNIINYCCDNCESEGIDYIAQNSCAATHHNNHHKTCCSENHYDFTIADYLHHSNECNLLRVNVETPTIQSVSKTVKQPVFNIQFLFSNEFIISHGFSTGLIYNSTLSPPDFLLSGRKILSLHSILLI